MACIRSQLILIASRLLLENPGNSNYKIDFNQFDNDSSLTFSVFPNDAACTDGCVVISICKAHNQAQLDGFESIALDFIRGKKDWYHLKCFKHQSAEIK